MSPDGQAESIDYAGRVILVTGAGRGLGRSHALTLAARGARVIVNDPGGSLDGGGSDLRLAETVVAEIAALGGEAVANFDTVATSDGAQAMISQAVATFGRVDGVLHNAGIITHAPLAELTDDQWQNMQDVHLTGAFYLTRAAWPHLSERGGTLLYISSAVGLYGVPSMGHYAAAKTGLLGLSRVAASEGAEKGIRANLLAVAGSTRMMDAAMEDSPDQAAWYAKYMKPELPASASAWLLHPDSKVTGRAFQAFGPHMAEIFIGETDGYTQLDITPEAFRDRFDTIRDMNSYWVPQGPDHFHSKSFEYIVAAGTEPPPASGLIANIQNHRADRAAV